jgi:hypothetical protein
MSRLGDEGLIPAHQHHLLVNTRFAPGVLGSRPGLAVDTDVGEVVCVTGLIETQENTGLGGPLRGLVAGWYETLLKGVNPYWFHLGPAVEEPYNPLQLESVGVDIISRPAGSPVSLFASWHPHQGTRFMWVFSVGLSTFRNPSFGPYNPFAFQGKTCHLGLNGSIPGATAQMYAITAKDDGSAGALNAVANLGTNPSFYPTSWAVRNEIIDGQVKEVLYVGQSDQVWRFDGVTLTSWTPLPGTNWSSHVYAQGQELLILVNGESFRDNDAYILHQSAPGAPITTATIPADLFYAVGDPARDQGGWSGAAKWRDTWYVFFEGGEPQEPESNPRTAFGGVIAATGGGTAAPLVFSQVYQNGPGTVLDGNRYYNIGSPLVWQDQLVFLFTNTLKNNANSARVWTADDGNATPDPPGIIGIGNLTDASGWQLPAVGGPPTGTFPSFQGNYNQAGHCWHTTVGNTYVHCTHELGKDTIWGLPWPNDEVEITNDGPGPTTDGLPLGSSMVAFFGDGEEG